MAGEGADAVPLRERPVPQGYARGAPLPWWAKLGLKLGLAALGLHGARARRLGLAEPSFFAADAHRLLDSPAAWVAHAEAVTGRRPRTLLELGPGRMVLRAPVLAAMGFGRIWYVDPEDSAPPEPGPYREAAAAARARGLSPPALGEDRAAILRACGARLLTGGPEALRAIPDGAVDLTVSEVVLEHVRREDMDPLLRELRRVTAPGGIGLHWVDFHDHLGGGLQHLRFGDAFWSGTLAARGGLHVNRLGLSAHVAGFRRAGFAVRVPDALVWPSPPPGPARPHPQARRPAADDRICHALLEVRPAD